MSEVTRNDVEWARSGIVVSPARDRVYCPFHDRWEDLIEEDGLCEWCCQRVPCALHGDGDEEVMVLIVVDE